jgi:hypothetical protein
MPSLFLWGFGIPLFALILLIRGRKNLQSLLMKKQLGFLYNGYREAMFFWEVVIAYRKFILIIISVIIK